MSTVWKLVIIILLIVVAYFGYQNFANQGIETSAVVEESTGTSTEPASTTAKSGNTNPPTTHISEAVDTQGNMAELEALAAKEEEKKKVEEKITLNEETGELIVSDPVTGEVIFRTTVEPELIPLTKENLALDFVTEIPDEANQATKEDTVSVYPPESSGQIPEQVIIKNGDDYEVLDVPDDSKALQFVESVPDDDHNI